jgi:diacylglycerol O-acyltransferase / wax synthase
MSYNGQMNFGLLGDYDAMADVRLVADGIEASLEELVALARAATATEGDGAASNGRAPSPGAPSSAPR